MKDIFREISRANLECDSTQSNFPVDFPSVAMLREIKCSLGIKVCSLSTSPHVQYAPDSHILLRWSIQSQGSASNI